MKLSRLVLFLLVLSLVLPAGNSRAEPLAPGDDWTFVRTGIDWRKFTITSPLPNEIFVARMQRSELSTTIETGIAGGTIVSDDPESVPDMAARYHGAINYWGYTEPISNTRVPAWGGRNDVAVAINGYFFGGDREPPGVPWSGVIHSGWYSKRFWENDETAGFAWTLNREAFIGFCVYHTGNDNNEASFENTSYTPNIDAINVPRDNEEFIIYTPQYASNTGTSGDVLELLVEMTSPSQVLPTPGSIGYLRKITDKRGSMPIPFDHVVLSFWGEKRNLMLSRINGDTINEGDQVGIIQQIIDCNGVPDRDWNQTYASLGGDYHFLNNGVYDPPDNSDANVANSRTVVAFNQNYVYFVVVDGWRPDSRGLSIAELTNFLKNTSDIQATDAVSLDSGGSSTFVVNGEILNDTYCNFTRNCGIQATQEFNKAADGGVVSTVVSSGIPNPETTGTVIPMEPNDCSPGNCEPMVGSSFLMISSQPILQSLTFTPTQEVTTVASTAIRLGPGTNYASLGTLPGGASGEVIDEINKLNGVLAKNGSGLSYWWFVDMGDLAGWVIEEALQGGSIPPGPPPIVFTDFQFMPAIARSALLAATTGQDVLPSAPLAEPTAVPLPGPKER